MGGNPVNKSDPSGFAPENGKPDSNPGMSEELQDYEIAGQYGEMRKEEEKEAAHGRLMQDSRRRDITHALFKKSSATIQQTRPSEHLIIKSVQNLSQKPEGKI